METQAQAEQLTATQVAPTGQPEPVPRPAPTLKAKPRWRRFFGWFWCSTEFSLARGALAAEGPTRRHFREKARAASDFAARALEPQFSDGGTNPDAVACELYRQSVYWSLLALKSPEAGGARPDARALLRDTDVRALLGEGSATPNASRAIELLEREDLTDLSERSREEQSQLLFALRGVAERLLLVLEGPEQALGVLWLRRVVRSSIIFLLLAGALVFAFTLRDVREQNTDLTLNKSWHASSSASTGCSSPLQYCDDSPSYFFHTAEERDPWVEFDLEQPRDFSSARVVNRRDCCGERASPLVLEVSDDQKKWKQIARHEGGFRTWKVEFPRQRARYVRVRAVGVTILHLAAVRLLP
jgi:hypothetical protein